MVSAERAKELLVKCGKVRPQPPEDWTGTFPLPPAMEQFYREVGPAKVTIKLPGNPLLIPALADLWKFQKGYSYGPGGKAISDWNDHWIVVADSGGDPLVFDFASGQVLHAYPGEDAWEGVVLFPDLATMAAALAVVSKFRGGDERDRLGEQLQELLGSGSDARLVLAELGVDAA